ncbi:MAG: GNAT family N-acetyltransferase [Micromonosporaceae bacterium]
MAADPVLETERLLLREFTAADLDRLVELDSDPEVMRFIGDSKPTPREVIETERLPHYLATYRSHPGFGRWAAIEKATGAFLGWFALDPPEALAPDTGPELGYRLSRAAWGRGYATEGSRALVAKAFTELGVERVWAQTMFVNTRSRRVMEKTGLRHVRTFHQEWDEPLPGTEHGEVEYELTRADWATQQPR